jgi:hypothetical protein
MINLDKVKMHVMQTAENGVVNKETIFSFTQNDSTIYAAYQGGKIKKGYLVGFIKDDVLKFNYCQIQMDDQLDNGSSSCELHIDEKGKIRLVEHFEWSSRPGEFGTNVFEEI